MRTKNLTISEGWRRGPFRDESSGHVGKNAHDVKKFPKKGGGVFGQSFGQCVLERCYFAINFSQDGSCSMFIGICCVKSAR